MTFNKGWLCANCGPVQEVESKTKLKVKRDCCKVCGATVKKWERPLNERPGRCNNCAHGSFSSKIYLGIFMRECRKCNEVINPDDGEILQQGKEELKYGL